MLLLYYDSALLSIEKVGKRAERTAGMVPYGADYADWWWNWLFGVNERRGVLDRCLSYYLSDPRSLKLPPLCRFKPVFNPPFPRAFRTLL
jgi:hypothetical protein